MLEIEEVYKIKQGSFSESELYFYSVVELADGVFTTTTEQIVINAEMFRVKILKTGEARTKRDGSVNGWVIDIWNAKEPNKKYTAFLATEQENILVEDDGMPWDAYQHPGEIWNAYSERWCLL